MVYKIVTVRINNDGTVTEGSRKRLYSSPIALSVGDLYFLGPCLSGKGKLYRIVELIPQ